MVTRSTPPSRSAVKAVGVVRKWYVFGCGVPRLVTAVSRFTAVKSADLSTDEIGPSAVAGSFSSFAVRPVKCTSPAKASVRLPGRAAARAGVLACVAGCEAGRSAVRAASCAGALQAAASSATTPESTASSRRVSTRLAYVPSAPPRRGAALWPAHDGRRCPRGVGGAGRDREGQLTVIVVSAWLPSEPTAMR